MYAKKGIRAYQKDSLRSDLASADPHRIIQLLMQGVLERCAQAKGAIDRRDFEAKAELLTRITDIINALNDALDPEVNPELVENLSSLYGYMNERVHQAGLEMRAEILDEVISLMLTIKSAWDQISDEAKVEAAQARS
ncbi:flagellar export chaperone FliS [Maribrevibacterium harenarium]|uniref:Flagellar secretion chaperone FliS n=1 Tax=Maribrevibacterium harenarium TaxID=2589817 RepID=A0A501X370_9GAMM|nr:flagellar export chaperone FliS [Maribrevibacterium harenarium]TPE54914.1 flagellar export chaperone FliS [Maribrevibacterium harenarium]